MRLIPRHSKQHRGKAPRVSITQAEITADLVYPAPARAHEGRTGSARRAAR